MALIENYNNLATIRKYKCSTQISLFAKNHLNRDSLSAEKIHIEIILGGRLRTQNSELRLWVKFRRMLKTVSLTKNEGLAQASGVNIYDLVNY